jgi:hypothetical protein
MRRTGQPELEFALDQLRWSLRQPHVYGHRDWAGRLARTLEWVRDAFDRHVKLVEAPDGPLADIADPEQLPFSEETQQVQRLLREHPSLRGCLELLAAQLRGALLLFPAPDPEHETLPEARAFRLFDALGWCVGDLLVALDAHLAAEEKLFGSSGSVRDLQPGTHKSGIRRTVS